MKKFVSLLLTGIVASFVAVSALPINFRSARAAAGDFSDNFNSYSDGYKIGGSIANNWTNAYLYNDGTTGNPPACDNTKFGIVNDPTNSGHGLTLKHFTLNPPESFSWISVKDKSFRKFEATYQINIPNAPWAVEHPENAPWFGVLVRKNKDDRFVNVNGLMLIFSIQQDLKTIKFAPKICLNGYTDLPVLNAPSTEKYGNASYTFPTQFTGNSWHTIKIISGGGGNTYSVSVSIDDVSFGLIVDECETLEDKTSKNMFSIISCMVDSYVDNVNIISKDNEPDIYPPVIDKDHKDGNVHKLNTKYDLEIPIDCKGNNLESITIVKDGDNKETNIPLPSSAYEAIKDKDGNTTQINIKAAYLNTLKAGSSNYTFRIKTDGAVYTFTDVFCLIAPAPDVPSIDVTSYDYKKLADSSLAENLKVVINKGNAAWDSLTNVTESAVLVKGTDYRETNGVISILPDYLYSLEVGTYTFKAETEGGSVNFTLNLTEEEITYEPPVVTSAPTSYTQKSDAVFKVYYDLKKATINKNLVKVDNQVISSEHFSVSGSILTLFNTYLDSLSVGNHSLSITTKGGSVATNFEVKEAVLGPAVNPDYKENTFLSGSSSPLKIYVNFNKNIDACSLKRGITNLTKGSDYVTGSDANGEYISLMPNFLNSRPVGNTDTFNISTIAGAGSDSFTVTYVSESSKPTIKLASSSYRIKSGATFTATINTQGSSLTAVKIDGNTLTLGTHYSVSGSTLTFLNSYLDTLTVSSHKVSIQTQSSSSSDVSFTVNEALNGPVVDSTSKSNAYTIGEATNIYIKVSFFSLPLSSLKEESNVLVENVDYKVSDSQITILSSYLRKKSNPGTLTYTVTTEGGFDTFTITFNTAKLDPTVSPSLASYKLGTSDDLPFTVNLQGENISSVTCDNVALATSAYELSNNDSVLSLKNAYLNTLSLGYHDFLINIASGKFCQFSVNILEASLPPVVDPNSKDVNYETESGDLDITVNFNGFALTSITCDSNVIPSSSYARYGSTLRLKEAFLSSLSEGAHNFVVSTEAGSDTFKVTITKKVVVYPPKINDVSLKNYTLGSGEAVLFNINLYGEALTSVTNNTLSLELTSEDYSLNAASTVLIINSSYLETLTADTTYSFSIETSAGNASFQIKIKQSGGIVDKDPLIVNEDSKNKTYTQGSDVQLTIGITLNDDTFLNLYLVTPTTSTKVDSSSYLVTSKAIIISPTFLDQLPVGDNNFAVLGDIADEFKEANSFTVKVIGKEVVPPSVDPETINYQKTGDDNNWITASLNKNGNEVTNVTLTYPDQSSASIFGDPTLDITESLIRLQESYFSSEGMYICTVYCGNASASFKINVSNPPAPTSSGDYSHRINSNEDVNVSIDLSGLSIVSLKDKNTLTLNEDYFYSNESLIIKSSYLNANYLNKGETARFTLTTAGGTCEIVVNILPELIAPEIAESSYVYEKGGYDLEILINDHDCSENIEVIIDDTVLTSEQYDYSNGILTINSATLDSFENGDHALVFKTLAGSDATKVSILKAKLPPVVDEHSKENNFVKDISSSVQINVSLDGLDITSIFNETSLSSLSATDYKFVNNAIIVSNNYLNTLTPDTTYTFRVITEGGYDTFNITISEKVDVDKPLVTPSVVELKDKADINNHLEKAAVSEGVPSTLTEDLFKLYQGQGILYIPQANPSPLDIGYLRDSTYIYKKVLSSDVFDQLKAYSIILPGNEGHDRQVFSVSINFEDLANVQCDGVDRFSADYFSFVDGQLKFEYAFFNNLSSGEHIITLIREDGQSCSFKLIINEAYAPVIDPACLENEHVIATDDNLSIKVYLDGFSITKIEGDSILSKENGDYVLSDDSFLISKNYLDKLTPAEYTFVVTTDAGEASFVVIIKAANVGRPVIDPTELTYEINSNVNVSMDVDFKGQFGYIKFGDSILVKGQDYIVSDSEVSILYTYLNTFAPSDESYIFSLYNDNGRYSEFTITIEGETIVNPVFNPDTIVQKYFKTSIQAVTYGVDYKGQIVKGVYYVNPEQEKVYLTNNQIKTDYIVSSDSITLTNAYVSLLDVGTYTFYLETNAEPQPFTLNVVNTIPEGGTPTVDKDKYSYEIDSGSSVSIEVNTKGLPVSKVINLDNNTALVKDTDYIVSSTGIVIKPSYLNNFTTGRHYFSISTEGEEIEGGKVDVSIKIKESTRIETHDYSVLATVLLITIPVAFGVTVFIIRRRKIK